MNRAEKTQKVEELKDSFEKARGIFVTDYRGLKVADLTQLRFDLKKSDTDFKVVKNRLALRALQALEKNGELKTLEEKFDNTTSVALTYGDVSSSAKVLTKFAKDNEKLQIKAGWVEGKVVDLNAIKALATLPSREELLGKLLGTLQAVPGGFVRVLNGLPAKWVYLLEAIRKQKEEQGGK